MSDKAMIGLSRLIALRQQVDTIANNVANQTTPGFKSQGMQFREYLRVVAVRNPTKSSSPRSGVLESSNVKVVQEVQASRVYDQVAKVILGKDDPNELRKLAGEDGQ